MDIFHKTMHLKETIIPLFYSLRWMVPNYISLYNNGLSCICIVGSHQRAIKTRGLNFWGQLPTSTFLCQLLVAQLLSYILSLLLICPMCLSGIFELVWTYNESWPCNQTAAEPGTKDHNNVKITEMIRETPSHQIPLSPAVSHKWCLRCVQCRSSTHGDQTKGALLELSK